MHRRSFLGALSAIPLVAGSRGEAAAAGCAESAGRTPEFDPTEQPLEALQSAMACGSLTAASLVHAYLGRIQRLDQAGPALHSVLAVNGRALDDARALDAERTAGRLRGPLHGIPLLIKDNIETSDPMPTTAGSRALSASRASADAPLVAKLRTAGCIVLGKSNLSEWANFRSSHSISGWSAVGGQTRNAYDQGRTPSGSSAGSAVATAASLCAAAIGSETDGSILSPSSVNGLVGFKPTVGVVSGRGIVPLSPRQDTAGPMSRTVTEAALLAGIIAERPLGFGPQGSDLEAFRLKGVRIGALPISPAAHPDTAALYAASRAALQSEGAIVIDLKPPASFAALGDLETEALLYEFKAAINEYLASLDPARSPCRSLADLIAFNRRDAVELTPFGQDTFEQAEACGPLTSAAYQKGLARLKRLSVTEGLGRLFGAPGVSALMAPGGGPAALIDPVWGDHSDDGGPAIASAAAIAGYPSLTVPAGLVHGLPIGMVFVGAPYQDGLLLQVGRAYERATRARVAPRFPS
jgi:amidase